MSVLYVCATPIGNLEDVSKRLLRVLTEVDLIAAEDTRQTLKLLNSFNISKPLTSYHKFNIRKKTAELINLLQQDKSIALVSDSGTPGISDPGYEIIRAAVEQNIRVIPIPGPSAIITALVVSGLPTERFVFEGFLPSSPKKRRRVLRELVEECRTIIFYESPHRILKTLQDICTILGEREIAICRELTKKFEEIIRGKVSEVLAKLKEREILGEMVIVVHGNSKA